MVITMGEKLCILQLCIHKLIPLGSTFRANHRDMVSYIGNCIGFKGKWEKLTLFKFEGLKVDNQFVILNFRIECL